jgi:hypothetical protein
MILELLATGSFIYSFLTYKEKIQSKIELRNLNYRIITLQNIINKNLN